MAGGIQHLILGGQVVDLDPQILSEASPHLVKHPLVHLTFVVCRLTNVRLCLPALAGGGGGKEEGVYVHCATSHIPRAARDPPSSKNSLSGLREMGEG